MYGIVEINGHQYQVKPGIILDVEKMGEDVKEGAFIDLENVLFIGGDTPLVGFPRVAGAKIHAKVIKHSRSRKLLILKRKAGKWQRKRGHRQHYTSLLITEIENGQGQSIKIDSESKLAQKFLQTQAT